MKVSLNWLRQYLRLPESADAVARLLTEHAFETTVVLSPPRASLADTCVGEVLSVSKHPQADRLSVVRVTLGKGKERDIVCGAPNVRAGLRVAVALPGAHVLDAEHHLQVLKEATIRGVRSAGMICSVRELGLGEEHGGILELSPDARVGASLDTLYPEDTLLEADVLPDRATDCLSHVGIARELSAIIGRSASLPTPTLPRRAKPTPFSVRVKDPLFAPRYIAVVLEEIHSPSSPPWMQERLRALGIRPQHLLVDVTNYVLWELGQPTHAFDARAIGKTLAVQEATAGQTLKTLDGVQRELPAGTLLITSDGKPLALAGIMGGAESAVREDTTRVVIEAATFNRAAIRKTVQALNLRTDASDRFSRGVTSFSVAAGAARVVELLVEYGGAKVVGMKDVAPRPRPARPLAVSQEMIEEVLGMTLSPRSVRSTLTRLGYAVTGSYRVTPPPFRADVAIPEDVIEDVGRMVGYEALPATVPVAPLVPATLPDIAQDTRRMQDALRAAGWMETYAYSFMPDEESLALQLHKIETLKVVNPLTKDQAHLRINLLPNLLSLARKAVKQTPLVRVFEIGHVYPARGEEGVHVAGILVRRGDARPDDFYDVKGAVEHLLGELRLSDVWFDPTDASPQDSLLAMWDPAAAAEIKIDTAEVGFVGRIAPEVLERLGIRGSVVAFELDVTHLTAIERAERVYRPPLPYPTVQRDLSLSFPDQVLVDEVREAIARTGGSLVQDVRFLDQFEQETGDRSVTLRITYGSAERTLRDEDVNALHTKIVAALEEKLSVTERV